MNFIDVFALVPESNNIVVRLWEDTNKQLEIDDALYSQIFESIHQGNNIGYLKLPNNIILSWQSWKIHNNIPVGYISFSTPPFNIINQIHDNINQAIEKIRTELEIQEISPPEISFPNHLPEKTDTILYYAKAIINKQNEIPIQSENKIYEMINALINNYYNLWPLETAIVPKNTNKQHWLKFTIQTPIPPIDEEEQKIIIKTINTAVKIILSPITMNKLQELLPTLYNYYKNQEKEKNITHVLNWISSNLPTKQAIKAFETLNNEITDEPKITAKIIQHFSQYLIKVKAEENLRLLNGSIAMLLTREEFPEQIKKHLLSLLLRNSEHLGEQDLLTTISNLAELYSIEKENTLKNELTNYVLSNKDKLTKTLNACISISESLKKLGATTEAILIRTQGIPFYINDNDFMRLKEEIISWLLSTQIPETQENKIYYEIGKNLAKLLTSPEKIPPLIDYLFQQASEQNKLLIFEKVITALIKNTSTAVFDQLTEYIMQKIKETPALYSLSLVLAVQKFEKSLEQHQFEEATILLRKLFNEIDFKDPEYTQLITELSASLITSAIENGYQPAIEEIKTRISLIFGEKSKEILYEILTKSIKEIISQKRKTAPEISYSVISLAIQLATQLNKKETEILNLLDQALEITAKNNLQEEYISILNQKIDLIAVQGKSAIDIYLKEIKRLIDANNTSLTKKLVDTALKEFENTPDIKIKIFDILLQYPEEIRNQLLTPSELLEYRKVVALVKGEQGGPEQTTKEFLQGIEDLTKRGDHELVRQFVLDAVKYARTKHLEKEIPTFIKAFAPSFNASLQAYKKSKSPVLYKDIYKNLHALLNEIYLAKEGIEIFTMGNALAQTNLECAEQKLTSLLKEKTPLTPTKTKIVLKFVYQSVQLLDELATTYRALHPAIKNDPLFEQFVNTYKNAAKLYTAITNVPECLTIKILTEFLIKHEAYHTAIQHLTTSTLIGKVKKFSLKSISSENTWAIVNSWKIIASKSENMTPDEFKMFLETIEKNIDTLKKPWKKNKLVIKQIEHLQLKIRKSLQATPESIHTELELLLSLMTKEI